MCFYVLSYSHTLLIEFKTYTVLCSFNAIRNVLGCNSCDHASRVTLLEERNTRWGSSFFSGLLKQRIFSLCKNTCHGYINRPFASASKLAAVLSTSLKYRLLGKTKRSQPCLSSISFVMPAHHGGRSNEEGSITGKLEFLRSFCSKVA